MVIKIFTGSDIVSIEKEINEFLQSVHSYEKIHFQIEHKGNVLFYIVVIEKIVYKEKN